MRVRIAPSPTGPIHVGNIRTALFNWLFARNRGGSFILRFEDTDISRSRRRYEAVIMEELRWLGLDYDEGGEVGGPYGPYRQTEKLDVYRERAQELVERGYAYPCYCSAEELERERRAAFAAGRAPRYSGRCGLLSAREGERLRQEGRVPSIRFRVPAVEQLAFEDVVRGRIEFDATSIGDFIILRESGIPVYNFAVVVDDIDMRITHVIRGDEHISNTPVQLMLYRALGQEPPLFAHVPMVLGPDRTKLSKRHGAAFVGEYRQMGYLPEALVNFLALIGWSPETGAEIMSREELVRSFSLERVSRGPGVFDVIKLNWMNAQYIRAAPVDRVTDLAIPFLRQAGLLTRKPTGNRLEWLRNVVGLVAGEVSYLAEIPERVRFFFGDGVEFEDPDALAVLVEPQAGRVLRAAVQRLRRTGRMDRERVRLFLHDISAELGLKGRELMMPLRVAITGRSHGPELKAVMWLVGRRKLLKRLEDALARIA